MFYITFSIFVSIFKFKSTIAKRCFYDELNSNYKSKKEQTFIKHKRERIIHNLQDLSRIKYLRIV